MNFAISVLFSLAHGKNGINAIVFEIGKRIIHLQASLALVQNPANSTGAIAEDPFGREHFTHPALDGLKNLSDGTRTLFTGKDKLAGLAKQHELLSVLRWAPRRVSLRAPCGYSLLIFYSNTASKPRWIRCRPRHGSHDVRDCRRHCSGKGWLCCQ